MCVHIFKIFSSLTTGQIETKFHVKPPWDGGTKVCSNGHGHMIKVAAMPIYGKNLKSSFTQEPKGLWPWNLICSIKCSNPSKFVQIFTVGWPWPILRQGQIWSLMLLYGKKSKTMDISETIVVYDVKVGRYSKLNKYMKLCEYQRSRSLTDFGPNLSDSILFFTSFPQ